MLGAKWGRKGEDVNGKDVGGGELYYVTIPPTLLQVTLPCS